jgi:CheY-like chemotaxis protein
LANILMASKTLEKVVEKLGLEGPAGDVVRSSSRVVIRCAIRMTRLVDDLHDFASIEAGQLSVVRAPHAPESVAREAIEAFLPMAEDSGVKLAGVFAPGALAIECDRDRIIQVLSNLLSNAIHASPRGGTVTVSVAESEGQAVFSVEDAGAGIPPDELPSIFDRYRRGRSALYKGAGLGLAIARKLVELHGGRIWAESTLGRGSAFRFRLPAVRQEATSDVLVVDDDADIRYALKTVLELEGYHVALAANGREAWEWLQSAPLPALILLDLMMPVMNGAELLGRVRADDRLQSVPVVLVTACDPLAQPVAAKSQGSLPKPFDPRHVIELASRYCTPRPH